VITGRGEIPVDVFEFEVMGYVPDNTRLETV